MEKANNRLGQQVLIVCTRLFTAFASVSWRFLWLLSFRTRIRTSRIYSFCCTCMNFGVGESSGLRRDCCTVLHVSVWPLCLFYAKRRPLLEVVLDSWDFCQWVSTTFFFSPPEGSPLKGVRDEIPLLGLTVSCDCWPEIPRIIKDSFLSICLLLSWRLVRLALESTLCWWPSEISPTTALLDTQHTIMQHN